MIGLFKLAFEVAAALALFIGGIKFGAKFPNLTAKIDSFLSFAKSQL